MNHRAFTLIELLVVVAIIGILAAVGVVAYNGYTGAAKKNVTKSNYNAMYKKILIQMQLCDIDGRVELMKLPKNTTKYKVDCASTSNHNLYMHYKFHLDQILAVVLYSGKDIFYNISIFILDIYDLYPLITT